LLSLIYINFISFSIIQVIVINDPIIYKIIEYPDFSFGIFIFFCIFDNHIIIAIKFDKNDNPNTINNIYLYLINGLYTNNIPNINNNTPIIVNNFTSFNCNSNCNSIGVLTNDLFLSSLVTMSKSFCPFVFVSKHPLFSKLSIPFVSELTHTFHKPVFVL